MQKLHHFLPAYQRFPTANEGYESLPINFTAGKYSKLTGLTRKKHTDRQKTLLLDAMTTARIMSPKPVYICYSHLNCGHLTDQRKTSMIDACEHQRLRCVAYWHQLKQNLSFLFKAPDFLVANSRPCCPRILITVLRNRCWWEAIKDPTALFNGTLHERYSQLTSQLLSWSFFYLQLENVPFPERTHRPDRQPLLNLLTLM